MLTDEEKKAAELENTEKDDPKVIDAEVGETIIDGEELFVVEEVSDEKGTKSDKDDDDTLEDESVEDSKSKDKSSDGDFKVDESMRLKMLEKKMDKTDRELAKANLTPEQIRQQVPLADLKADIKRQRTLLSDIDKEINPEEWARQNGIITTLENDIAEKERTARLDERYKSKDNTDFLKNERKLLADKGFEFSDQQFDGIAVAAEDYLVDGKFTKESIRKGLIDIIGADNTDKMYEVSSEQKIRDNLKVAASKVTKSTRITRSGIHARLVPFAKRLLTISDPDELEKALDGLSTEQYAVYKKAKSIKQNKK